MLTTTSTGSAAPARPAKSGQTFMIATPADARNLDKVLKLIGKAPEEIVLDIDWSSIKDEPRSPRGRDGGRRQRTWADGPASRDRRPRSCGLARSSVHGEHASTEPFDPTAEVTAPAPSAQAPATERPATERSERGGRSRGRRGGSERRPDDGAFLLRFRSEAAGCEPRAGPCAAPGTPTGTGARAATAGRAPAAQRDLTKERTSRPRPSRRTRPSGRSDDGDDGVVGFGQRRAGLSLEGPSRALRRLADHGSVTGCRSSRRFNPCLALPRLDFFPRARVVRLTLAVKPD